MKELYISPELNVICFAPVERLANDADLLFHGFELFIGFLRRFFIIGLICKKLLNKTLAVLIYLQDSCQNHFAVGR